MKRFLALLLAAVMLISFTACKSEDGEKGKNTDKEDKTPVFSENAVKDNTYENKSTGISCTLGTGWTFCSGEQGAILTLGTTLLCMVTLPALYMLLNFVIGW